MGYLWALAIQAVSLLIAIYRHRGFALSPDGHFYLARQNGYKVPEPYSRRWLIPLTLPKFIQAWEVATSLAYLAMGPLVYDLTGSLICVWLVAWLPGLMVSLRFPVLVDQIALTMAVFAACLWNHGFAIPAIAVLGLSAFAKESAPFFGAALAFSLPTAITALVAGGASWYIGRRMRIPGTEPHMLRPFRTAMGKHDPLDWKEMLLPWGSVLILSMGFAMQSDAYGYGFYAAVASLIMGYGQLLFANDSVRLYQWAAPAVCVWMAPYQPTWAVCVLMVHPFLCGAVRRI